MRKIREALMAAFGDEYASLSTADVNTRWVQPLTAAYECRLVELPDVVAPVDVGVPDYFISHAWKNSFELLLQGVESYLESASEETRVWIDITAVCQHPGAHQKADVSAFKDVVRAASRGTLVVMDISNCNPATRGWCIYEWAATLGFHGPDGLHMQLNAEDRETLVSAIDVEAAECFNPQDKVFILEDVVAQHGSVTAFNNMLRLQLLLEPLSYSVDLRRLQERSRGTEWDFAPVESWLDEGAAGRQVLCVMAGAGEGKSTISAALCGSAATKDRISAHHFIKYSDVRRLEPLRFVKTLTFQLANRIPALRDHVLGLKAGQVIALPNGEQAFSTLLADPFRYKIARTHCDEEDTAPPAPGAAAVQKAGPEQIVLLVDALDEADPPPPDPSVGAAAAAGAPGGPSSSSPALEVCGNKLLLLLAKVLLTLPRFVRFIFTTRPDASSGNIRAFLDATLGGAQFVPPQALRRAEQQQEAAAATAGAAAAVNTAAGGGVLVYNTVADACLRKQLGQEPPPLAGPPRLDDLYAAYNTVFAAGMGRLSPEHADGVRSLLGVLLAAQEPLADSLLASMGLALVPQLPGAPVLFFSDEHRVFVLHKSLSDWLTSTSSGALGVSRLSGHATLARRLLVPIRKGGAPSAYAIKYLVRHLVASNDSDNLDWLLTNYAFLATIFRQGHGYALIRDLAAKPQPTPLQADALRWLLAFQHKLIAVRTEVEILELALQAPLESLVFKAATEHADERTRTGGGTPWRQVNCLGGPSGAVTWMQQRLEVEIHSSRAAWSPDGRVLAASNGGFVHLYDTGSGELVAVLAQGDLEVMAKGYGDWKRAQVIGIAWSPDGRSLAIGKSDRVQLWDTVSGHCRATPYVGNVSAVALSSDGRRLAGACEKRMLVWDTDSGEEVASLEVENGDMCAVSWAPAGRRIVLGTKTSKYKEGRPDAIQIWDTETGETRPFAQHADPEDAQRFERYSYEEGVSLTWSPDGRCIAVARYEADFFDKKCCPLQVWDAESGRCVTNCVYPESSRTFLPGSRIGLHSGLNCVHWSADSAQLFTAGRDHCMRMWDANTGLCLLTLKTPFSDDRQKADHFNGTRYAALSPDGRTMVTCGMALVFWDLEAAKADAATESAELERYTKAREEAERAEAEAREVDDKYKDFDGGRWMVTPSVSHPPPPPVLHKGSIISVAWDPSGSGKIAACTQAGSPLWMRDAGDARSARCTALFRGGKVEPHKPADMRLMLRGPVRELTREIQGHRGDICGLAWELDGERIITLGGDELIIWDADSGAILDKERIDSPPMGLSWSPDGAKVARAAFKAVEVWLPEEEEEEKAIIKLEGHEHHVLATAWSPDSARFASASVDETVKVWDVAEKACVLTLQAKGVLGCVAWSADGAWIAAGEEQGSHDAMVWSAASGEVVATLQGHTDDVTCVDFNRGSVRTQLVSGGKDHKLRVWDVQAGVCLAVLMGHTAPLRSVSWSVSDVIASGAEDKCIRLWQTST